jgi:hypothetical protein
VKARVPRPYVTVRLTAFTTLIVAATASGSVLSYVVVGCSLLTITCWGGSLLTFGSPMSTRVAPPTRRLLQFGSVFAATVLLIASIYTLSMEPMRVLVLIGSALLLPITVTELAIAPAVEWW